MVDNGLGSTALYADNPAERDDAEESSCLWDMIVVVVKSSAPTTTNNIMVVCLDGGGRAFHIVDFTDQPAKRVLRKQPQHE